MNDADGEDDGDDDDDDDGDDENTDDKNQWLFWKTKTTILTTTDVWR
jgi:hypothetical protein